MPTQLYINTTQNVVLLKAQNTKTALFPPFATTAKYSQQFKQLYNFPDKDCQCSICKVTTSYITQYQLSTTFGHLLSLLYGSQYTNLISDLSSTAPVSLHTSAVLLSRGSFVLLRYFLAAAGVFWLTNRNICMLKVVNQTKII